jgi:hypothetical protein
MQSARGILITADKKVDKVTGAASINTGCARLSREINVSYGSRTGVFLHS